MQFRLFYLVIRCVAFLSISSCDYINSLLLIVCVPEWGMSMNNRMPPKSHAMCLYGCICCRKLFQMLVIGDEL